MALIWIAATNRCFDYIIDKENFYSNIALMFHKSYILELF